MHTQIHTRDEGVPSTDVLGGQDVSDISLGRHGRGAGGGSVATVRPRIPGSLGQLAQAVRVSAG